MEHLESLRQLNKENIEHEIEIKKLNNVKKENIKKACKLLMEHYGRKNGDVVTIDKKKWKIRGMFAKFDDFLGLTYVELNAYCWPIKKDGTVDERSDPNNNIQTLGRLKLSE